MVFRSRQLLRYNRGQWPKQYFGHGQNLPRENRMIPEYLQKRNVAVVIYLGCIAAAMWLGYSGSDAGPLLGLPAGVSLIAACWFYLRAKNRSVAWLLCKRPADPPMNS